MTNSSPTVTPTTNGPPSLGYPRIFKTWWPLAASWMLMGFEGPAVSAVVSRLADPKVNLAAYGGLVFPLAVLIEAPVIMLLAASTALSRDWDSYLKLRRFMMWLGAALTLLHILVVATPLYYLVARDLIRAPPEVIEPARVGLLIMIPWTWAIAYRRFNQGVLIRFGRSLRVGFGTGVRFGSEVTVLAAGYFIGSLSGIVVAAAALTAGVAAEALYAHFSVQSTLRTRMKRAPSGARPLTTRGLLSFYVPLSLTQVIFYLAPPIGSAAISRMPHALESLAAWPVITGVSYLARSFGGAYNEVVVALAEEPRSMVKLRRFAVAVGSTAFLALIVFAATPLAGLVFRRLLDLAPPLPAIARTALWFVLPMPVLAVAQSYFQGTILFSRHTRSITESVLIFLAATSAFLVGGVLWGAITGIFLAVAAFTTGESLRTCWLWVRSSRARRVLRERDDASAASVRSRTD
jgi:hypothetical protein